MRRLLIIWAVLLSLTGLGQTVFVPNEGQWEHPADFVAQVSNGAFFFTPDSLVVTLVNPEDVRHVHNDHHHTLTSIATHSFSIKFEGGDMSNTVGRVPQSSPRHYFVGDEQKWRSNVQVYQELWMEEVYPGIDVVFYHSDQGLKYDWHVKPGADPSQIAVHYNGLERLKVGKRRLVFKTSVGKFAESAPYAHDANGAVDVHYVQRDDLLGFNVLQEAVEGTLVIDPIMVFSTFSGSTADNFGYTATFDSEGNAFAGGIAFGIGYPTSLGAFNNTFAGGWFDVSLSKFNAAGDSLLWSAYLGGSGVEQPHSIDCDPDGNLYVFGTTGSDDFATTATALDTTFNKGKSVNIGFLNFPEGTDIFISKISADGGTLHGSTYLGGDGNEGYNTSINMNYGDAIRGEIEVLAAGPVVIVSTADSSEYPITTGMTGYQGYQDGVVSVLSNNLSQLWASTYVGSTQWGDILNSLTLSDKESTAPQDTMRLYVSGAWVNFNATGTSPLRYAGQVQSLPVYGASDALLVAFDLQYTQNSATLIPKKAMSYGTALDDQNFFVEMMLYTLDPNRFVVTGQTKGVYPSDPGLWGQDSSVQFLQEWEFTGSGFSLQKSLTFGDGDHSSIDVSPTALLVDFCGNTYFSGWGGGPNKEGNTHGMTVTPNALKSTTDGNDFYFLVLNSDWTQVKFASYFGGTANEHVDGGTSRFDHGGRIFQGVCAGCGGSNNYPTTTGAYSTTNNSTNCNMAVTVINMDAQEAQLDIQPMPAAGCAPFDLSVVNGSANINQWTVDFGNGVVMDSTHFPEYTYTDTGVYQVMVIGFDTLCGSQDTAYFSVEVFEGFDSSAMVLNYSPCTVQYQAEGTVFRASDSAALGGRYTAHWEFYIGASALSFYSDTAFCTLPGPGSYPVSVTVMDTLCNVVQVIWDTVHFTAASNLWISEEILECSSEPSNFYAIGTGYQQYHWFVNGQDQGTNGHLQLLGNGQYQLLLVGYDTICNRTDTVTTTVELYSEQSEVKVPNVITPNGDNVNDRWSLDYGEIEWVSIRVQVYNRWGNLVFDTTDENFEWWGDHEGQILAAGAYIYIIDGTTRCGEEIHKEGIITILYD